MTLIRTVAMKISGVVVRYASPGCKEWAEGLAHELEFIDDDLAALRWAIGSTRVLLDRRDAPVTSAADIPVAARLLSQSLRKETNGCAILFVLACNGVLKLLSAGSLQQRVNCGLVVFGATYMGAVLLMRRRMRQAPRTEDVGAWTLYYRTELERLRDFYSFGIGAAYHVILPFYFVGGFLVSAFTAKGGIRGNIFLTVIGVLFYLLYLLLWSLPRRQTRRFQRQIDALDVVLKETR
jgi:hypothetical protein